MSTVHAPHLPGFVRAGLHAVAVVGGGLLLLNLLFGVHAIWQSLVGDVVRDVVGPGPLPAWVDVAAHGSFVVGVLLMTWLVVAWRPYSLVTAIWLAAPTATVLISLGLVTPMLVAFGVGGALVACALVLLLAWHRPWEQVLSVSWVTVLVALIPLLHLTP